MSVMLFLGKKYSHILQFRMLKVLGKKNQARFPLLYRVPTSWANFPTSDWL